MEIRYSEKSEKQITRIKRGDRKSAEMIIKAIENYAENSTGIFDIKTLKGRYEDLKRLRIGDYRVLFENDKNVMSVYEVRHRQGAYK